jgi:hypothetical protein
MKNQLVKKIADEWWRPMERLILIEALPIKLMLLPMPMKGGLKIAADEIGSVPMKRRSMKIPS